MRPARFRPSAIELAPSRFAMSTSPEITSGLVSTTWSGPGSSGIPHAIFGWWSTTFPCNTSVPPPSTGISSFSPVMYVNAWFCRSPNSFLAKKPLAACPGLSFRALIPSWTLPSLIADTAICTPVWSPTIHNTNPSSYPACATWVIIHDEPEPFSSSPNWNQRGRLSLCARKTTILTEAATKAAASSATANLGISTRARKNANLAGCCAGRSLSRSSGGDTGSGARLAISRNSAPISEYESRRARQFGQVSTWRAASTGAGSPSYRTETNGSASWQFITLSSFTGFPYTANEDNVMNCHEAEPFVLIHRFSIHGAIPRALRTGAILLCPVERRGCGPVRHTSSPPPLAATVHSAIPAQAARTRLSAAEWSRGSRKLFRRADSRRGADAATSPPPSCERYQKGMPSVSIGMDRSPAGAATVVRTYLVLRRQQPGHCPNRSSGSRAPEDSDCDKASQKPLRCGPLPAPTTHRLPAFTTPALIFAGGSQKVRGDRSLFLR